MTELMRWRMAGYLAVLFIAGAITGAAVMARNAAGSQTLKIGRSEEIASLIRLRLSALDLTPEERAKFEPLIKQTSEELEASHLQCLQRCSVAVEALYAQIKMELKPEQIEKFNQLEMERRALMRKKYNYPPEAPQAGHP